MEDDRLLAELRAAAAPPLRTTPADGTGGAAVPSIEGFTLVRELSRGSQGQVWLARQHEPPRDVALKLLRGHDRGARARLRFEREIELAARLRHPHVVTVYASGCAGGVAWCAMELVDGVPLDEWLRRREPQRRGRLELFAKIARAVGHAHERGVLHRDLKPANVLIDGDGAPHVLDFGIARALLDDAGARRAATVAGEFVGTLAYAAPEQMAGDPSAIDTRTDVHALGAILFEMVTGALPYDTSGGLADAVDRIAHEAPRRARAIDPTVDPELDAVIATALARVPEDRYGSAQAVADDVEHLLRGEPVAARGNGAWYVLRKSLARRRRAVALGLAAAAVLVAGGVVLARQRLAASQAERTAADVRAVLLDLVSAARPDRMGGNVPLPEILEEAARRLDGRLDGVPDARAELLLAIGETYCRLQRDESAQPHLKAALEQARRAGAPLLVARAAHALGLAHGDHDQSSALLEEALTIRARELGSSSGPAAETRSALGATLVRRDRSPDAEQGEALLREALDELRAAYGDDDPEVARARIRLGMACARRGADAEAEQHLRGAVELLEARRPADPDLAIESLHGLASFLQTRKRFDEAEAQLARALEITRAQFGDDQAPDMLRYFARLHYARGDFVSSDRVSRQAVSEELQCGTRRRPEMAATVAPIVAALADASKPAPWSAAFDAMRTLRGEGSYEVAGWMNGMSLLCSAQGRLDTAEELVRGALRFHCRVWGDECPTRARAFEVLAELQRRRGAVDEAAGSERAAAEIRAHGRGSR
jgi:serine/threonine-protein kinase